MEKEQPLRVAELEQRATDYRNNGQTKQAIELYAQLRDHFLHKGSLERAAGMQHMIGVTYKVANDTQPSLEALAKARGLYEEAGDVVGVARVARDEGITYQYVHDYDKAQPLLEMSIAKLQTLHKQRPNNLVVEELGISQVKLGHLLEERGELDAAEVYISAGLQTLDTTDQWFYRSTALYHLAQLRWHQRRHGEAIAAMENARHIMLENGGEKGQRRRLAQFSYLIADIYTDMGRREEAENHNAQAREYTVGLDEASFQYLQDERGRSVHARASRS